MLLAVTADAPTTALPRAEVLGGLTLDRRAGADGAGQFPQRGQAQDRAGWRIPEQRAPDRRGPSAQCLRPVARPLRRVAPRPARRPHRAGHVKLRRMRTFALSALVVPAGALVLTSCAGADQEGSAAHQMSVWVSGTGFGQDIGTLIADNARVPKDVANGTGAVHAACSTLLNDAEMANTDLPVSRSHRHSPPHQGLWARGHRRQRLLRRRHEQHQAPELLLPRRHQGRGVVLAGSQAHPCRSTAGCRRRRPPPTTRTGASSDEPAASSDERRNLRMTGSRRATRF